MKNLDWHQAWWLATYERRAIRDEGAGWRKWLLFRDAAWLLSELSEEGIETRRVVPAPSFTDAQFLSHSWTDEAWEGGSYPPCTLGPATELPAAAEGGAWTYEQRCAGEGEGGNVLPIAVAEDSGGTVGGEIFLLTQIGGDPLMTDGAGCWLETPDIYAAMMRWIVNPAEVTDYVVLTWTSATGVSFAGLAMAHEGAITGAAGPLDFDLAGHPDYTGLVGIVADDTYVPNQLLTGRVALKATTAGPIIAVRNFSLRTPGLCVWLSEERSFTAECEEGTHGTPVTVTKEAGAYSSAVSQEAANDAALEAATAEALGELTCAPGWVNAERSFTAECPAGQHGASVTATVEAGEFVSMVSQEDADDLALTAAEAAAEGEIVCDLDFQNVEVTVSCPEGQVGTPVTVAAGTFTSPISQEAADALAFDAAMEDLECVPE